MAISFSGGKRYKKHNGFSENAEIKAPLPSPAHIYNLIQNNDIALKPLAENGSRVLKGQKLADLDIYEALPVISSVSGIVTSVTDNAMTVENDMLYDEIIIPERTSNTDSLTSRELLWLIREGGICDTRTGIPAHIQLSASKVPDCVIVCCFDSDPYVSAPQFASLNNAEKILRGLDIALRLLGTKKAFIAVEQTEKKTFYDFKYHLRYNKDISLYLLKPRYPQSKDDILIRTLTGKSADNINTLIMSPETLYNISNVIENGRSVTEKIVTVSGDDILPPSAYSVPLGMPVSVLIANSGYTDPQLTLLNGVIDGEYITDTDIPVTGSTNAVTAFNDKNNVPKYAKKLI